MDGLIDFFDSGTGRRGTGRGSSWSRGAGRGSAGRVQFGDDRLAQLFDLLAFVIELFLLGQLIGVDPLDGLGALVEDGLTVGGRDLVLVLVVLDGLLHLETVGLEAVLGSDALPLLLVLVAVLVGLVDHAFDLLFGQAALVVGDGDLVLAARRLVGGGHVEDAVGVDVEGDLDLGDAARRRRDTRQFELTQQVVVFGHGALALVDLDQNARLVVGVRRKHLRR